MNWTTADVISSYAEVNDLIVFRKSRFGLFRQKRYARVTKIDRDEGRPLIERIHVVEVKDPRIFKPANSKITTLNVLMRDNEGYFLDKVINNQAKDEKKKGFFGKIASFISQMLDRFQNFVEGICAKIENWHESNSSSWGYKVRRIAYHLGVFVVESLFGIAVMLLIAAALFLIFWYLSVALACIYGLFTPGSPVLFPFTIFMAV